MSEAPVQKIEGVVRRDLRFYDSLYFGCVVFELLTGKPPYTGESANNLLNKHLRAAVPSPRKYNPKIAPIFSDYLQGWLAKHPDGRPVAMEQVIEQLSHQEIFTTAEK